MRFGFALLLLAATAGCSSFYEHSIRTDRYSLYGNDDVEQLQSTGEFLDRGLTGFRKLFPERQDRVPAPRVIYSEDDLARRHIFTSEVRQEGYYFPWFQLIHLSPRDYSAEPRGIGQAQRVILHELAHHFLLNAFPRSGSMYWLNEGLACALETSFFGDDDALIVPLYHSWLHQQAHQRLLESGPERLGQDLLRLVRGNWFHFHRADDKVYHYSISWAFTYYLLSLTQGSIEQRVAEVVQLDPPTFVRRLPGFLRWLGRSPEVEIERITDRAESCEWALRAWLELPRVTAGRFLTKLEPGLRAPRGTAARVVALELLTEFLARPEVAQELGPVEMAARHSLVAQELEFGEPSEQLAIAQAVRPTTEPDPFARPLVQLLESELPELRVAAARALARIASKRTITRPDFWRSAPRDLRTAEVLEWEIWLRERGL
ncbi:MAG: hypothetical protein AB7O52_11415 [Planctomycetota bacterium]